MKKFYVLLLVALLVLVGCSNDETAKDEIVSILGKDQLVMATSADYPPYEFIQEVNGKQKIVGFDIFMAEYIAEQWGVDLVIQDVKFEALLTGLETGMYDMVIAGMTPSPERKANFSDIYYNATHGVVIRKDSIDEIKTKEDLDGKHIGAQLGSIQEGIADGIPNVQKKALSAVNTLLLELKTGKIDAIIMEKPVAKSYVQSNDDLMLVEDIEFFDESGGSAIAMQEGADELTEQVNIVLKDIKEKGLMDQWVIEANDIVNNAETKSYNHLFLQGLKNTLLLSGLALLIGLFLGLLLTTMRRSEITIISFIAKAIVELLRGTPLMLQILIVYYGLDILGLNLSAFMASLIAVSLNSSAYVSEIVRSGIESIDKGQMEAGRSLGLSKKQTMSKIIMPQAIRNILPALGNEFITLIKETSIASTIGVAELMYQTSKIQSLTFEAMKPLLLVSLIYFALTFGLSLIMKKVERNLKYDY